MKVYFYSPVKAVLEVNGQRFFISKNIKAAEFDSDAVFSIFAYGFKPCRASFLYAELNKNVAIIELYKGFLIVPVLKKDFSDKEVNFEKTASLYGSQYSFTVKNTDKMYLTARGYRVEKTLALDILPKEIIVTPLKNHIAVEVKNKITRLIVFSANDLSVKLNVAAGKIFLSDTIVTERLFIGADEYVLSEQYSLSPFKKIKNYLDRKKTKTDNELIDGLMFFETLNYGGDVSVFLSDELKEKNEALKNFIPPFKIILPPIEEEYPDTFTLIGDTVKYARLKFDCGRISDIDIDEIPQN